MKAHLIAAGKYHDIDYARLELLKLLAEVPEIRTSVAASYADGALIEAADLLITYTCDLVPSDEELPALNAFLEKGGRWLALHGTNSIIRFGDSGMATTPNEAPDFMKLLGTRFLGHPPIEPFKVNVVDHDHPVSAGIRDFKVEDELYLSERTDEIDVLMASTFEGGPTPDFEADLPAQSDVPILYERKVGAGSILYCTLGHCRGHYDLRPLADYWPHPQRCAWDYPVFHEILRRSIRWGMKL